MRYNPSCVFTITQNLRANREAIEEASEHILVSTTPDSGDWYFVTGFDEVEFSSDYDDGLLPFLRKTKGEAHVFVVWEYGDSFSYVHTKDGAEVANICFDGEALLQLIRKSVLEDDEAMEHAVMELPFP